MSQAMNTPPPPRLSDILAPRVHIFHAGALGDHVLLWPLFRLLLNENPGRSLTLIAHTSHARLTAATLGSQFADPSRFRIASIESPHASRLWQPDTQVDCQQVDPHANVVLSFLADESTPGGAAWLANARATFPNALVISLAGPASPTHDRFWHEARSHPASLVQPRHNPDGPIQLFTGAGGEHKRWPMNSWQALREAIRSHDPQIEVVTLAGPVEAERFTCDDRATFQALGGVICDDLLDLASTIARSRAFVGADTGPTHLAAQLGVPTLALFGPTDPNVWSPVGPAVRVLCPHARSPESQRPMLVFTPAEVAEELRRFIER
ncbi:MAG: glycosyltransferase family 9 protein [Phycisphaerales bacterium]|nr:glycosyltransferase family 9 protein [Phycisphaerales bacterium]